MVKIKQISAIAFALIFMIAFGYAQEKQSPEGKGKITGSVLDKIDNSPIEGASVTVTKEKDGSRAAGTQTDIKGAFSIEVPYGRYKLEVNLVGYSIVSVTGIVVSPKNPETALDVIKLKQGSTTTEEIEVTGERSYMQLEPDKKVFNVGQDLTNLGGSATDVLKNIPSVQVDLDGNVSLRGSGDVKIYIDGRPSGINADNMAQMLEQIPASSIESVELITNPTAKYEAEGSSGIINIVLKRNVDFGYNGNVSMNVGTKDKYNGSFNLNLKNKKFNISTNYSYRLFNMFGSGTLYRENEISSSSSILDQTSSFTRRMNGHFGKAEIDYLLDDKNVLTFSTRFRKSERLGGENSTSTNMDNFLNLTSIYTSKSDEKDNGFDIDLSLGYSGKFKNPKNTLTAEISFSRDKDDEVNNLVQQSFDSNYTLTSNPFLQNTYENGSRDLYNAQLDYIQPIGKDSKFETGLKALYRKNTSDFNSDTFSYSQNTWIPDINLNNDFTYKEQIYALYGIYTGKFSNFGYQLGARVEQTFTKGELIATNGETFDRKYIDVFPNINLSQKFGESSEIQLSYSRRIRRPRGHSLNPFTDYSDPYNLHSGNPDLKPEYIDSYELSFAQYLPGTVVTPSIFYRKTNNMISRTIQLIDSNTTLSTFSNDASGNAYGVELVVTSSPFKWLNFNGNVSYFKNEVKGTGSLENYNNSNSTWTGRVMTNVILPAGFGLQAAFNYQGAMVMPQGTLDPLYSFDAAMKKDLFDKKLTINFRVSDIFKTQKFNANVNGTGFTQSFIRQRDSRTAFITLTYKFGTPEKKNMRERKKEENNNEDNNETPDFDF
jgi:outer membrane receptor protein involved in Fe transport